MSDKVVYDTARQAAAYWVKSIVSRAKFIQKMNNKLANPKRIIILTDSQKKSLSEESIRAYETALAELISEKLEQDGSVKIVTGFGADGLLIQAANRIGYEVSMISVPFETTMVVTKSAVDINSVHKRTQLT